MKKRWVKTVCITVLAFALGGMNGCANQKVETYAKEMPELDLQTYFNGTLDAYGIFTDRSGEVVKRFTVVMECHWVGNRGTLDESFTYSDGTVQKRIWHLTKLGPHQYSGTAQDVVGIAQGQSAGNAFHWNYTLELPVGGTADKPQDATVLHVQMDDWMYLIDAKVMLNKATMSKFGVRLGEVTLSFVKR